MARRAPWQVSGSPRRWPPVLLLAALTAVAPAAIWPAGAVANRTVPAGSLTFEAETEPWGMTFRQQHGPTLREAGGAGLGATGSIGFRTAAGWFHATGATSERGRGGSYRAMLATSDPAGRELELEVELDGDGVARVSAKVVGGPAADVTAVGIGFDSIGGERYLGFGERSNAVDQSGNEVENYVSDGPYQPEERALFELFVPPQGYHPRDDATYFPMPWLLSSAGYGVLIENTEVSYFRLGSDDPRAWSLEAEARKLAFRVFAGPKPADVVRRLTRFTGRQPKPAAPWFLGPWYQPTADDPIDEAERLRDSDVPTSVANTFLHYLPCGDQVGKRRAAREQTAAFHRLGYAITTYFNPMVCDNYQPVFDDAAAAGVLTANRLGEPYRYRYASGVGPDRQFMVGQFDFSAPGADDFYGGLLDDAVGDGFDGWMEDFGEYTPLDSISANGMGGKRMHNIYPVLYHRSSSRYTEQQERPIGAYVRSGWTGVHPYAQLVWGGDPTQDWGFDGLESAVYQGLNMGMSGISRWGSAIGGFFAIGQRNRTPELLKRWIQLGAVSGIMRTEKNGVSVPPRSRPQVTDPEILPTWRRYAKLRTQLYPYIQAADRSYRRTGMPLMRHMAIEFPADPAAVNRDDQFMFGPDILAAPVVSPGLTERDLYLPRGRWVDLGEALRYRAATGQLRLGRAEPDRGGRETTVEAPLERLPLLARAGSVIAMLPPGVDTLASYGGSRTANLVRLSDRRRRLHLLALPRGRSVARFGLAGRLKSVEGRRGWRLRIRGAPGARYRLQASMLTLKQPVEPCRLSYGGRMLDRDRWSYSESTGVLRASLKDRHRRATLRVRGC